ncbi:MAG TPA: S53 family peptidase [Ktedonobacterales bacterium]
MRLWPARIRGLAGSARAAGIGVLSGCLVALTVSTLGVFAGPAPGGPPAFHARHGHQVALSGTLPRALVHSQRLRRMPGSQSLQLAVSLQIQRPADLTALVASQQDPKSPQYHKYLTPQAFADQFGPSPDTVAAVRKFLTDGGLHVTGVSANRLLIDATGTVAVAEKTFQITISQYQLHGRIVFAPDHNPMIPDTLATSILNVAGLDNVGQARPLLQQSALAPAHPKAGPAGGFTPSDLRGAYDVTSLITAGGDGTGQRIGVFELAPYIPGDLAAFRTNYTLPSATMIPHYIDNAQVTCIGGGTICDVPGVSEADLDVEVVSALAPNATQDVYTGPNTGQGVLDTYQAIVANNYDRVTTTSWGLCEQDSGTNFLQALDNIFVQGAVQGQTIFAAAGDNGSTDCAQPSTSAGVLAVDSPASDPYVAGVGGTALTLSSGAYSSEVTWNDSGSPHFNPIGTGGGNSTYFGRPSWQVDNGVPNAPARSVPDVAANADPYTGYSIYCTSTNVYNGCPGASGWTVFGGTSAAAPFWAAILADINGYLLTNAKPTTGWANPALYQLLGGSQTYAPFHDVITGNNDLNAGSPPGGFSAGACYDQVTGVGTPDAWNIARDFQAGVDTSGHSASCPIPVAFQTVNLVQAGGFETTGPWQQFSQGGYSLLAPGHPHTGSNGFFACFYPSCDDRVQQILEVPASVVSATLSYYFDADSALNSTAPALSCQDHFTATLANPDGTVFDTVQSTCATTAGGYTLESFDVTTALQAHRGQPIVLMFRGTAANEVGNAGFITAWFVDDVSLAIRTF